MAVHHLHHCGVVFTDGSGNREGQYIPAASGMLTHVAYFMICAQSLQRKDRESLFDYLIYLLPSTLLSKWVWRFSCWCNRGLQFSYDGTLRVSRRFEGSCHLHLQGLLTHKKEPSNFNHTTRCHICLFVLMF